MTDGPTDDEVERAVFTRVRECLGRLVGSSGHLSSYEVSRDDFRLTGTEPLDDELVRYEFSAQGRCQSEFATPPDGHAPETVAGAIVLDEGYDLTFDDRARVRFSPYDVVHPRFWRDPDQWMADWDPPRPGAFDGEVPEVLASGFNPLHWRTATHEKVRDEVARLLDERGEVVVFVDSNADKVDREAFETAMAHLSSEVEADNELSVVTGFLEVTRAVFRRPGVEAP